MLAMPLIPSPSRFFGGKMDDITALVAYVTRSDGPAAGPASAGEEPASPRSKL